MISELIALVFAAWNASVARTERLTENGRVFMRIHAEKIDSATQFWIDGGEIALPGCRSSKIPPSAGPISSGTL